MLEVKESRACKLLKELNEKGVLEKEGSYRNRCYRIAEENTYDIRKNFR